MSDVPQDPKVPAPVAEAYVAAVQGIRTAIEELHDHFATDRCEQTMAMMRQINVEQRTRA